MKKLTTNQWLLIGGTVALIWVLYNKNKMTASQIKDEIKNDLSGTGGLKPAPTKPSVAECKERNAKWLEVSKTTRWGSEEQMNKARKEILGECLQASSLTQPFDKSVMAIVTR